MSKTNKVNLGLIKEKRKSIPLHQKEIARLLEIAPNTYTGWETGKRRIDINKIPLLCKVLSITLDEFFLK